SNACGWASRPTTNTFVANGEQFTYTSTITASSTAGTYTLTGQMVHENQCWFGATVSKTITVTAPDNTLPTVTPPTPTCVNTLTPTISFNATDTGSGLNVGSAEFAYSVDGGSTYTTYVGRYVMHYKGKAGSYVAADIFH